MAKTKTEPAGSSPAAPAKISIWLGNVDTKDAYMSRRPATQDEIRAGAGLNEDGTISELIHTHLAGNRVCSVSMPASEMANGFRNVTDPRGIWAAQSWAPPAWVHSDDERLGQMLALHYGCPAGLPDDIDDWIGSDGVPRAIPRKG